MVDLVNKPYCLICFVLHASLTAMVISMAVIMTESMIYKGIIPAHTLLLNIGFFYFLNGIDKDWLWYSSISTTACAFQCSSRPGWAWTQKKITTKKKIRKKLYFIIGLSLIKIRPWKWTPSQLTHHPYTCKHSGLPWWARPSTGWSLIDRFHEKRSLREPRILQLLITNSTGLISPLPNSSNPMMSSALSSGNCFVLWYT